MNCNKRKHIFKLFLALPYNKQALMKVQINNINISAIASWLPTDSLEMSSLASEYGEHEVNNIIKTTGIKRSRIAAASETASDMCFHAATHLIEQEKIDRAEIDGLVFISQTADYILPATSVCLQDRLGLGKETVCLDIHYGCSGYIYGLFQAALLLQSKACNNVLVLAGDTTSRLINPKDKSLRMVFGDCGTATLLTHGNHPMGITIHSDGSGFNRVIVPAGGFRTPVSEKTSELHYDEDKNGRTANDIFMDGMSVFNFAIFNVPKDINELLDLMKWQKDEVGLFALHQANEFMVRYIGKKMKAPQEKVPVNVENYGNTGPASIPLLLSDILSDHHAFDLDKVVMGSIGVGFSWGSIACNMSETRIYSPVNK
jgi:3-oxoacyl-[acyl-carrier-protein] synthase-3